jgi:uridine kinase
VRRGLALLRDQQRVVAHAVRQGCRRATGDQAYAELTADGRTATPPYGRR